MCWPSQVGDLSCGRDVSRCEGCGFAGLARWERCDVVVMCPGLRDVGVLAWPGGRSVMWPCVQV